MPPTRTQGLDFDAQLLRRFPYLYVRHGNKEYEELSDSIWVYGLGGESWIVKYTREALKIK